jgi:hypothetical protein
MARNFEERVDKGSTREGKMYLNMHLGINKVYVQYTQFGSGSL